MGSVRRAARLPDRPRIPLGALFLSEYNLDEETFLIQNRRKHKIAANIETIMKAYPDLPFVLMGDSGEKDPLIYATSPASIRSASGRSTSRTASRRRDARVQAIVRGRSRSACRSGWCRILRRRQHARRNRLDPPRRAACYPPAA
ncbi:MAG: phosphatase domain-containing protein [Anaerolineae bacterium]